MMVMLGFLGTRKKRRTSQLVAAVLFCHQMCHQNYLQGGEGDEEQ